MNNASNQLSLTFIIAAIVLVGCQDDKDSVRPTLPAACLIEKEYNVGSLSYIAYEYNGGLPSKFTTYNEVGTPINLLEVFALYVRKTDVDKSNSHPYSFSLNYDSDYLSISPESVSISYTVDNVTTTEYMAYLYRYDYKGRMIEINEFTPHIPNDLEYKVNVAYDDNDNAIEIRYKVTTGPATDSTKVLVSGYDNNPTPYSGVKGWKYLMSNFAWNNADPLPVVLALSKNNPAEIRFLVNDKETFRVSYTYQYNTDGFPTQRDHVNKIGANEFKFSKAFEYRCQ